MLFTVAEWVVHSCVDQVGGTHIVTEVLLGASDAAVGLRLAIVEIVIVGVVSEGPIVHLHVVTV